MTVPAVEVEHAYRRCEEITRHEAANFYYGIRLLPRGKRYAMSAVYAFARRVDDIGDGDGLRSDGQLAALADAREVLAAVAADRADRDDPVAVALANAHLHYRLPLDALELLVEGVELDVLDSRSAACVLAMTGIYRGILERIEREPETVLRRRISLPVWEKAWVAVRSLTAPRANGSVTSARVNGAVS